VSTTVTFRVLPRDPRHALVAVRCHAGASLYRVGLRDLEPAGEIDVLGKSFARLPAASRTALWQTALLTRNDQCERTVTVPAAPRVRP
jgi:hypothetical protein